MWAQEVAGECLLMKLTFPRQEGSVHVANAMAAGWSDAGRKAQQVWKGEAGYQLD